MRTPKEEGGGGFRALERGATIRKRNRGFPSGSQDQWANSMKSHFSGQESCFACPVHCGQRIQHPESSFGATHLEKAWQLGPRIGVYNGEWTLKLYHLCQAQGLDPFLTGSLLARIMKGEENGSPLDEDLRQFDNIWEDGEKAFAILHRIIEGSKNGFRPLVFPIPEKEDLDVLADIIPFCTIVVNRLNLATVQNMIDLIDAATGYGLSKEDLRDIVRNILRMESILHNKGGYWSDRSSPPHMREGQISEISRREEQTHESIVYRKTS